MRIHEISLQNFRGVSGRKLKFPDRGVIVLQGPNEVGKSSIVDALDLLLEEKDSSAKHSIKAIKPVSADVPTSVEAELSTGKYRFVYRKQWNKQPSTTLQILNPKPENLTGVQAHERVLAILRETLDDDLWRALRIMQAGSAGKAALVDSRALARALDDAAGDSVDSAAHDDLFELIETEYLKYFTPTGKTTGAHNSQIQALAQADGLAQDSRNKLDEVDADAARYESLALDMRSIAKQFATAEDELAANELSLANMRNLQTELDLVQDKVRLADAALEKSREAHATRHGLIQRHEDRAAAYAAANNKSDSIRYALGPTESKLKSVIAATKKTAEIEVIRSGDLELAKSDVAHFRHVIDCDDLTDRLNDITESNKTLIELAKDTPAVPIDQSMIDQIEQASTALVVARAQQQSASARLTVKLLSTTELSVNGEVLETRTGREVSIPITDEKEILLADVASITATPGTDGGALAAAVEARNQELSSALEEANASDPKDARRQLELQQDRLRKVAATQAEIERLLSGSVEADLRANRVELETRITNYLKARAKKPPLPAHFAEAIEALQGAESALHSAQDERHTAEASHQELSRLVESSGTELAVAEALERTAGEELSRATDLLDEARKVAPDDGLEGAVKECTEARQEATAQYARESEKLAELDINSIATLADNSRSLVSRLHDESEHTKNQMQQLKIRLEFMGQEGRQEAFDAAMSELERASQILRATESRANAARTLRDIFARHRSQARRRYAAPFKNKVGELGRLVYGSTFSVEVDDNLEIESRTLDNTTIEYPALSTGAKEQLSIISRLACALLIDENDGVPVIFDDALGFSDPARLKRMGAVFSTAVESQVFLLTSTPERYAGIGAATVLTLEPA